MPNPLDLQMILQLQRTVGNQRVNVLLSPRREVPPQSPDPQLPPQKPSLWRRLLDRLSTFLRWEEPNDNVEPQS